MNAGGVIGLALACGLVLILTALTSRSASLRGRRTHVVERWAIAAGMPRLSMVGLVLGCALCGAVASAVALMIAGLPVLALVAGAVGAAAPVLALRRRASTRQKQVRAAWPDAVDALVSGVRAGMSLPEALGSLSERGPAPLRPAFALFVAEHRATGSFPVSLDVLQDRLADPVADRVVASLRIARDVGGCDVGVVLRTLSGLLREDARIRGEIEGRQSWTVSAARMAVAAPWITVALLCTRPEAVQAFRMPLGAAVLIAAAASTAVAYSLMMRIGRLPAERRLVS